MRQHCQFKRIDELHLECNLCHSAIRHPHDTPAVRLCSVEAPDPPERDVSGLPCRFRGAALQKTPANAFGCRHELVTEYACQIHGCCTLDEKVRGVQSCVACLELPIAASIPVAPLAEMQSDWEIPETAPLVLHCVLSAQFEDIYSRFFLPSLKRLRDPRIGLQVHRLEIEGNGDFGTAAYFDCLKQRCASVVEALESMPDGEIAVFCDVDIAFLNRFSETLLACMDGMDLAFAEERLASGPCEINFGFFAARKSSETIAFLSAVRDSREQNDQDACRELLKETTLRWRKLPREFSNFGLRVNEHAHADLLYHATNTAPHDGKTSLQLKTEALESVLSRRLTREVVVARHTEGAAWLQRISLPAIVYDKSPERLSDSIALANRGREADTYLRHILEHYDDLAAVTVFAQGDPFPHVPKMRSEILLECEDYIELETRFFPVEFANTKHGFRLLDAWRKLFGRTPPPENLTYACGAQFAVTRERIRKRSQEFYRRALAVANWPKGPWIIERLWSFVFGDTPEDIRPADGTVSIVCAARNNGQYLREALESAVNQTIPCEVIYVDDCSIDDSLEIARGVPGVRVFQRREHAGVCAARNFGISASSGKFIVHLDGDDILPADYVAEHLKCMYDDTPFVYGPSRAFGSDTYLWEVPDRDSADAWQQNFANTSSLYRRETLEAVGGWRDASVTMWDWDLALRASRLGVPVASNATLLYRHHPESWSHQIGELHETKAERMRFVRRLNARLAIGTVISGRVKGLFPQWLSRIAVSVRFMHLRKPVPLVILDNSSGPDFRVAMKAEAAKYGGAFLEVRFVDFGENVQQFDDPAQRQDAVARFVATACNRLLEEMRDADLCWFVEDDVMVPQAAGERLYDALTTGLEIPHAASGLYRSRHNPRTLICGWNNGTHWLEAKITPKSTVRVDFSGTGCLMFWRARCPQSFASHIQGIPAHDWAWCMELRDMGGKLLLLPSVSCGHAISESEILPA